MNIRLFMISLTLLTFVGQITNAQTKYSKVFVDRQIKDTFSFAKKWDYSWELFKDDSTGEFTRNDDQPLTAADTAHLYYTANCFTNVQGGYDIRYCFANNDKGITTLTFYDGLPAYASEFFLYIKGDSFYFKPKTIYPSYIPRQKILYRVTKQKLKLNRSNYKIGDTIIGYVDAEFIETVSVPKKGTKQHKLYLRGYFRTQLKRQT
ncbi:MAG: hypothetical protein IT249_08755 [Chitinophagaceae bacterium]|nr:hypothetical protein [Chitinophagaceae bacterium]